MNTMMLMLMVPDEHKEEVEVYLRSKGLSGFTEIPHLAGEGRKEPHLGSRAFPGTTAVVCSLAMEDQIEEIRDGLLGMCGHDIRVLAWPVRVLE